MKLIKNVEVDGDFIFNIADFDFKDIFYEYGCFLIVPFDNERMRSCLDAVKLELHMDLSLDQPLFDVYAAQDEEIWDSVGTLMFSNYEIIKLLWEILKNYEGD